MIPAASASSLSLRGSAPERVHASSNITAQTMKKLFPVILAFAAAVLSYAAEPSIPWRNITTKPTTVGGYGITDAQALGTPAPTTVALPRLTSALRAAIATPNTPVTIRFVCFGSSIGNGGGLVSLDPSQYAPGPYLVSQLNAFLNRHGAYNFVVYNRSHNGGVIYDAVKYDADPLLTGDVDKWVAEGITATVAILVYGMNDGQTANFNAGQTFGGGPGVTTSFPALVRRLQETLNMDVIVMTSVHPHTANTAWSMQSGISETWPSVIAAPVSDSAVWPPVSGSVLNISWRGTTIPISKRHGLVNEAMRITAQDLGAALIDVEMYDRDARARLGQDALGISGWTNHPNDTGYGQTYHRAAYDFAKAYADSFGASVTVPNRSLANDKLAGVAQNTIKGRVSAGSGAVEDLTPAQGRAVLGLATTTTDNAVARFDGTTGLTQNSPVVIDDSGNISGVGNVAISTGTPAVTVSDSSAAAPSKTIATVTYQARNSGNVLQDQVKWTYSQNDHASGSNDAKAALGLVSGNTLRDVYTASSDPTTSAITTTLRSDFLEWRTPTGTLAGTLETGAAHGGLTSSAPRLFYGTNANSGDDSAILIGRNLLGSYVSGSHAVRDESTFNASGGGLYAYASFDAIPTFNGSAAYNHLHNFQARPQFAGSTSITAIRGLTYQLTHSGTGTVAENVGAYFSDALGTGPITFNAAIYINQLSRGASNYSIYSAGSQPSYHGGRWQTGEDILAAGKVTGSNLKFDQGLNNLSLAIAGPSVSTGAYNTYLGQNVGNGGGGQRNTFIGADAALSVNTTTNDNTYIGAYAGTNGTGSSNVFVGARAGYYETGSNKLIIDNAQRSSEADARLKALVTGDFAAATKDQKFQVNGVHAVATDLNYNTAGPVTITVPDNTGGQLILVSTQGGIGKSTWVIQYTKNGGTLVIGTPAKTIISADPISAAAESSGNVSITLLAANTNLRWGFVAAPF
jgi:hypothetical protein